MLYVSELDPNFAKLNKNICNPKYNGAVDHSRVNSLLKEFSTDCKNLGNQTRSDGPETLSYLPTPQLGQDMTHGQFLSEV